MRLAEKLDRYEELLDAHEISWREIPEIYAKHLIERTCKKLGLPLAPAPARARIAKRKKEAGK